ncbi:MAG: hypothetical protein CMN77_05135 [Spirochaetaceae bacterium]|nr:hypothetical protein [Spirochaetaceae bacterium]
MKALRISSSRPGQSQTLALFWILSLCLVCLIWSPSVYPEEILDPTIPDGIDSPDSGKGKNSEFVFVRPGIGASRLILTIRDQAGQKSRIQTPSFVSPFLDISSRDRIFADWYGFKLGMNIWAHAEHFEMRNQTITLFSSTEDTVSNEFRYKATRPIEGEYYSIHPTAFFEIPLVNIRFGFGVGGAQTRFSGEVEFYRFGIPFFFRDSTRAEALSNTRLILLQSGSIFRGDVLRDYLVFNLDQGNNLELLGKYYLSRGRIYLSPEDLVLYRYIAGNSEYSLLDFIALSQINRERIRVRTPILLSTRFYLEYNWANLLVFRLSAGGPSFTSGPYDYQIRATNLAVMINLRF